MIDALQTLAGLWLVLLAVAGVGPGTTAWLRTRLKAA